MKGRPNAYMKYKDTRVMIKTSKIIAVYYLAKGGDTADDNTMMIWLW